MFGQGFNSGFFKVPCFTDTTDIFKDRSGVALYTLDYDASDAGGASGKFGEAAIFNGSSSYINLGTGSSGLSGALNQKVSQSVSLWMNTAYTGISGNSIIYSVYAGGGISLNIYYFTNGTLYFLTRYTNSDTTFTTSQTFNDSQWHHIAVTIDVPNLERKIYIDNSLVSTQALSSNAYGGSGTTGVALGTNGNFNTQYYKGDLDQVRIYDTVLTSSQVTQLYQENNSTVSTHLFGCIANYNLDGSAKESMGTTAYDGTETDIIYRYNGNPTAVDFGVGGKSLYGARFNGSSSKLTNMPFIAANSSYSISLWFKTSSSARQSIIASNSSTHSIALNINNGQLAIHETDVGDSDTFTGTWNDGNWHHLVMVNKSAIWVDGVSRGTTTQDLFENEKLEFGYWEHSGPIYYFNGSLDQVRIFSKALNSTEVSKLYGNGAGEIACEYTATTTNSNYPIANTAYYKLDNSAVDETGNYPGTETNIEYRFGRFGQSSVFNGSSSNIELPNSSLGITDSSNFSISYWFNTNSTTQDNQSVVWANASNAGARFGTGLNSPSQGGDTSVFFGMPINGSFTYINSGTSAFTANTWVHVVCVKSSTTGMSLYVDNVLKATNTGATGSGSATATGKNTIGSYYTGGPHGSFFNGSIDQVRIYSTALDSGQVTKLYEEKPEIDTSNFKTVLYEGNGGTQYISNVGFEPDMVWIKSRSDSDHHVLLDSIRGGTNPLVSSGTAAEIPDTDYIQSFDANGFTIKFDSQRLDFSHNENGDPLVAWCWKGGGDAVSNTDGSITSQVSANTEAGFSIVKYTGNNSSNTTVGHGLSSTPEMLIVKNTADDINWFVWNKDLGGGNKLLKLNNTDGVATRANQFDSTVPTSTVFSVGSHNGTNGSGDTMIAYCWHSVAGYSKIGNYTGNGSSTGPIVYTTDDGTSGGSNGFEPKFIMIKRTDTSGYGWYIMDSARGMSGATGKFLFADTSASEGTLGAGGLQTNSTGFQITDAGAGFNANLGTYIYMAFK